MRTWRTPILGTSKPYTISTPPRQVEQLLEFTMKNRISAVITRDVWVPSPELYADAFDWVAIQPFTPQLILFAAEGFTQVDLENIREGITRDHHAILATFSAQLTLSLAAKGRFKYEDNPLYWPAIIHQKPLGTAHSLAAHPMSRQRCSETRPRQKDLANRPLRYEFEPFERFDPDAGEYIAAFPFACLALRRELHPSALELEITLFPPDQEPLTLSYKDLWQNCTLIIAAGALGKNNAPYAMNCVDCPVRGSECLGERVVRTSLRLRKGGTGELKDFVWPTLNMPALNTDAVRDSVEVMTFNVMQATGGKQYSHLYVEHAGYRKLIVSKSSSERRAMANSRHTAPLSLAPQDLEMVRLLRAQRVQIQVAMQRLAKDTCSKGPASPCALKGTCRRWKKTTCTQRWSDLSAVVEGSVAVAEEGLAADMLCALQEMLSGIGNSAALFEYTQEDGSSSYCALAMGWEDGPVIRVVSILRSAATTHYATPHVADLLQHLHSRVSGATQCVLRRVKKRLGQLRPYKAGHLSAAWAMAELAQAYGRVGHVYLARPFDQDVSGSILGSGAQVRMLPKRLRRDDTLPHLNIGVTTVYDLRGLWGLVRKRSEWFHYVPE